MRVLSGLLVAAAAVSAAPAQQNRRDLLEAFERQLKAVHETAGPAMACVVVSRSDQYPKPATPPDYAGRLGGYDVAKFLEANPTQDRLARRLDLADLQAVADHESAAGVVIDPAGLVLTNFHAVEGARKVYVHLPGGRGSYADIHAADGRSDLAVLRLLTPPNGLKAVKLGTNHIDPLPGGPPTVFAGKLVAVLAFQPAGGFAPDRPAGTITALSDIKYPPWNPNTLEPPQSVYRYAPLLELESQSALNVSGAAVLNLDGELVGLTSTVAVVSGGDGGRAYALVADANFRRIVETLARGEEVEYGFLGIVIASAGPGGVIVREVSPRSPADGRLRPGQVIVKINGQPTRSYPDLLYQIGSTLAGNKATLAVRGPDGQDQPVEVTVAKFKHDGPVIAANRPAPVFGLRVDWGSTLAQGASQPVPPGVAVRELIPNSPAAGRFRELGDTARWVVTSVNGTPIPTPAAFYRAARGQDSVRLTVLDSADRAARPREVTLP